MKGGQFILMEELWAQFIIMEESRFVVVLEEGYFDRFILITLLSFPEFVDLLVDLMFSSL